MSAAVALKEGAVIELPPRGLPILSAVPGGYFAHAETTAGTMPLVRPGEVVVVDPRDTRPADGGLFVIEWGRSRTIGPDRVLVQLWTRPFTHHPSGEERIGWWAGLYAGRGRGGMVDGPYPDAEDDNGWYLPSLLIGRVIGLYAPSELAVQHD